jgi:hypothetical protein
MNKLDKKCLLYCKKNSKFQDPSSTFLTTKRGIHEANPVSTTNGTKWIGLSGEKNLKGRGLIRTN